MRYARIIRGRQVSLQCSGDLEAQAHGLLALLEQEDAAYGVLAPNKRIQVGWCFYQVLSAENGLELVTYDYAGDAGQIVRDLSLSLEILSRQRRVLAQAGTAPEAVSFQDTMIARRSALKAARVYMERSARNGNDSGWYLGTLGDPPSEDPADYVRLQTCRLLSICRAAVDVLCLPAGCLCVFAEGRLIEAVDGSGRKLL